VQLDAVYAVLRDVKNGEIRADTVMKRLERSRHWVWTALDPASKLRVVIDLGPRTLTMAQGVVHHVAQILAPDCAPLFLTDGLKEYLTALLTHSGHGVQPPRQRTHGPAPKPRWMPLPPLL
jgi:hypothetical protein